MKQSEVKELQTKELEEKLLDLKASYSSMKMTHAVSPLENPLEIRVTRRNIARIATEINKRKKVGQ